MQFDHRLRIFNSPIFLSEKKIKQVEMITRVIKELKTVIAQYRFAACFSQALLDTVVEANLTPKIGKEISMGVYLTGS